MATRILVADPDEALLTVYEAQLVRDGFAVATARSGLDCVEALRAFRPHLLILEPAIPWGGGDGVLDAMHDVWELPSIPVFVITSHETLARLDLRQFPLVTHLQTKPVRPDVLANLVRHIADEHCLGDGAACQWAPRASFQAEPRPDMVRQHS